MAKHDGKDLSVIQYPTPVEAVTSRSIRAFSKEVVLFLNEMNNDPIGTASYITQDAKGKYNKRIDDILALLLKLDGEVMRANDEFGNIEKPITIPEPPKPMRNYQFENVYHMVYTMRDRITRGDSARAPNGLLHEEYIIARDDLMEAKRILNEDVYTDEDVPLYQRSGPTVPPREHSRIGIQPDDPSQSGG